ncbi:Serologically defined colon cancer antigen 1 [Giardia lamblia P15]|uniref:Serologically defined colon cancer antigen 1 n=1 Tax=Giardia intestinalis (strain P15) TaxID=658858 RepID=E1F2Q3_GIAIA|nr:Serologically defined colon cancer antigen 1 [Giardia lamblia P15]
MSVSRKLTPSSFDVAVLAKELSAILVNTRLNSVTNLSKTTYLLRFHASTTVIDQCQTKNQTLIDTYSKPSVIIEPGFYMHATRFDWSKAIPPTVFSNRLRTEICNMICTGVSQFYFDRVIILEFSRYNSELKRYLIVELYGRGNLILTDETYKVLAAQSKMPGQYIGGNYFSMHGDDRVTLMDIEKLCTVDHFKQIIARASKQKGQNASFRAAIAKDFFLGGSASAIVLRAVNCKTSIKAKAVQEDEQLMIKLWKVCEGVLKCLIEAAKSSFDSLLSKGYIYFYREDELAIVDTGEGDLDDTIMTAIRVAEYHIFDIRSIYQEGTLYRAEDIREYESYNKTLDEYNSLLVTARAYQNRAQLVQKAKLTLAHAQDTTENRVASLLNSATRKRLLAECILWKAAEIDYLTKQMEFLFKTERVTWNDVIVWMNYGSMDVPLLEAISSVDVVRKVVSFNISIFASDIHDMHYEDCTPFLALSKSRATAKQEIPDLEASDETEDNDEQQGYGSCENTRIMPDPTEPIIISVDVPFKGTAGTNAHTIAKTLFEAAKAAEEKCKRTLGHSSAYFDKVEKKATADIDSVMKETDAELIALQHQRSPLWFEKFHWFFSTNGYLVLSGRDAQSNELLVKKFMSPNDIFVHSEAHGAACTIVKAPRLTTTDAPQENTVLRWVPPEQTMLEAGAFTVIHSKMWTQKVGTQSYWVYADQVSKTAPAGMYIGTGSFVIRGKRNFIPQQPLELGVALLWRYDTPNVIDPTSEVPSPWQVAYSDKSEAIVCTMKDAEQAVDESGKLLVLSTQKQKSQVTTAEQVLKDSNKDEKKRLQKERQAKIRAQKQQAKIKRLISEGRLEEAESYKKIISAQRNDDSQDDAGDRRNLCSLDFCCLCGTLGHNKNFCTASFMNKDYKKLFDSRISPVLATMWKSVASIPLFTCITGDTVVHSDDVLLEEVQDDSQEHIDKNGGEQNMTSLSVSAMISTKRPTEDELPGLVIMIAPYSVVKHLCGVIRIIPGDITKGKTHRLVQKILLDNKRLELSRYEQLCIKQIPEHVIVLGIPGSMNIQSCEAKK